MTGIVNHIIMADIRHGVAGGMAGVAVDVVFYPLQTIKTRIMGSSAKQNLTTIARSKFRGFSCQMVVSFPYSFTFFYTYETVRKMLGTSHIANALASVSAQITANIVRNPFQVVKQQLMVGRAEGILQSLRDISSNRGLKGLYTGYKSTLARDIVFSAVQLPLFEWLRTYNPMNLSPLVSASLSGSVAACIAGLISCPLDVLKTRLMTEQMSYHSTKNMITQLYQENGIAAFFRGAKFRCGILSFGGIVYFGALQRARELLHIE